MKRNKALAFIFVAAIFGIASLILKGEVSRPVPIQTYRILPGLGTRFQSRTGCKVLILNGDGTTAARGYWDSEKRFRLIFVSEDTPYIPETQKKDK